MYKRVIAFILLMAMFFNLNTTFVYAADGDIPEVGEESELPEPTATPEVTTTPSPTPEIAEKVITDVSITDTITEIPYGATFNENNISLLVEYEDGTSQKVIPDQPVVIDTMLIGQREVEVFYQEFSLVYAYTVVPRQVTGARMMDGTKTSMKVVWNALEEVDKYEIYTATKKKGEYTLLCETESAEYLFENLIQGVVQYVKIRGIKEGIAGEMSDALPVTAKPEAVTSVKADSCERTKVTLSWEYTTGATGYAVYYRLSTGTTYTLAGTTKDLKYTVTGLAGGKDYYFKVHAYGGNTTNLGDASPEVMYGTAPVVPDITYVAGGDKLVKFYWDKARGAEKYEIYYSLDEKSGFVLADTVVANGSMRYILKGLKQNQTYYVKVVAKRTAAGMELKTESAIKSATTKKAEKTSTKAKYYTTKKKFKNSAAYKNYKAFRKKVVYSKSPVVPGQKVTNIAGFNSTRMVNQGVTFAGDYMLISAYDYIKVNETVIYVLKKSNGKYVTSLVLPHKGHVGGMAYDGKNLWLAYGKKVQCLKKSVLDKAVKSKEDFYVVDSFTATYPMPDTVSYVAYYKSRVWVGTYSETQKKYMYGYTIANKTKVPVLTQKNKMLMPNRTQGVAFTSDGRMIISRSCQTKPGKTGFMSQLDVYKPTWNLDKVSVKKNTRKNVVKLPPMNEGIAISGKYTYVVYESPAFSDCPAPVDRVTAFKTSKLIE